MIQRIWIYLEHVGFLFLEINTCLKVIFLVWTITPPLVIYFSLSRYLMSLLCFMKKLYDNMCITDANGFIETHDL